MHQNHDENLECTVIIPDIEIRIFILFLFFVAIFYGHIFIYKMSSLTLCQITVRIMINTNNNQESIMVF